MNNFKGICCVALMPRNLDLPPDFLLANINAQALDRAWKLTNDKRRADFLWGRVLLTHLAQNFDAGTKLAERPPKTPLIIDGGIPLFATISHTRTWIGAAVSDAPIAIDVEVMAPRRANPAIFDRVFGAGAWIKYAQDDPVGLFYRMWGLYECSVKLEGRLIGAAHAAHVQLEHAQKTIDCHHEFYALEDDTLLTVVGNFKSVELKLAKVTTNRLTLSAYPHPILEP